MIYRIEPAADARSVYFEDSGTSMDWSIGQLLSAQLACSEKLINTLF